MSNSIVLLLKDFVSHAKEQKLVKNLFRRKNMKTFIYVLGLCLTFTIQFAHAKFSESEEQQIQRMIESYLNQNPDILYDLILNYSREKAKEAEKTAISLSYNSEGDGRFGNPNASFIIYEYSDYNCGYCKKLFKTLQTLINEDDDILIVIKEFPILSESSVLAAKAALAAEEQNKFLEYHLALMNSVGRITEDSLKSIATMVGLNMEQFRAAISSNKFDQILRRNINSGRAIGIEGTPALLIGKKIIPGAISLKEIIAIIDSERNKN